MAAVLQPHDANKENPSPLAVPMAKKVRKRRKSLVSGPTSDGQDPLPASSFAAPEDGIETLRFKLDNALQDNEMLQDDVVGA